MTGLEAGEKKTMRAVICNAYGSPDTLSVGNLPVPELGAGEVRIRVVCAGVNFPDSLIIQGQYQLRPPMPFAPGFEVAGDIIELGPDTADRQIGDRVMALTSSGFGAFAEQAVAKSSDLTLIPDGVDYATATALYTAYGTAYHALVQRGQLRPGETLVVLGASGGVGLAAVELGKQLGATVIAVGRTRDRLAIAREKGADHCLGYAQDDLRACIRDLTDGRGADVCIDMLGGETFDTMSRCMNWGGRLLVVGFTSGIIPKLPINLTLLKGYSLVGVWWAPFIANAPAENAANFEVLGKMLKDGRITPHIGGRFALEDVPGALNLLLDRKVTGKLVIDVQPR
jgi:NADPH:quinone reductase